MIDEKHIAGFCDFINTHRRSGSTTLAIRALQNTNRGLLIVPDRATKQFVIQYSRRQIKVKTFQEIAENRGGVDSKTPYLLDNSAAEQLAIRAAGYCRIFDENLKLREQLQDTRKVLGFVEDQNRQLYLECAPYLKIIRILNKIFRRKAK